jgi:hypothetical protein
MLTASTVLGLTPDTAMAMPLQTLGWMLLAHLKRTGKAPKSTVDTMEAERTLDQIEAMLNASQGT